MPSRPARAGRRGARARALARCAPRGRHPGVAPVERRRAPDATALLVAERRRRRLGAAPARPPRSPATTPSAPSNLPPLGTESRCDPVQTRTYRRCAPIRLPAPSTSTSRPASRIQRGQIVCLVLLATCRRRGSRRRPPPMAYSSSSRSSTRTARSSRSWTWTPAATARRRTWSIGSTVAAAR